MSEGSVGNMAELGITESFQVKRQVLLSASEAAEMILRVDNIIKAAPRSVHHTPNASWWCIQVPFSCYVTILLKAASII